MTPRDGFSLFMNQLNLLNEVVNESPYLSGEIRKGFEKEIHELTEKFKEGGGLLSTRGADD